MKIERKFYEQFEETIKNDERVREHYGRGDIKAAEEYIREELLDEELDKFVSIHKPDASRIRDFFKAYITDNEIRDIIEKKDYNRLATNPKVSIADLKALSSSFVGRRLF